MTEYYELHITMTDGKEPFIFSDLANTVLGPDSWSSFIQFKVEQEKGWKYSRIDGDPVEGPGIKHYATRQLSTSNVTREEVLVYLKRIRMNLEAAGINVTRDKIELVIHDSSSSKVRI